MPSPGQPLADALQVRRDLLDVAINRVIRHQPAQRAFAFAETRDDLADLRQGDLDVFQGVVAQGLLDPLDGLRGRGHQIRGFRAPELRVRRQAGRRGIAFVDVEYVAADERAALDLDAVAFVQYQRLVEPGLDPHLVILQPDLLDLADRHAAHHDRMPDRQILHRIENDLQRVIGPEQLFFTQYGGQRQQHENHRKGENADGNFRDDLFLFFIWQKPDGHPAG